MLVSQDGEAKSQRERINLLEEPSPRKPRMETREGLGTVAPLRKRSSLIADRDGARVLPSRMSLAQDACPFRPGVISPRCLPNGRSLAARATSLGLRCPETVAIPVSLVLYEWN